MSVTDLYRKSFSTICTIPKQKDKIVAVDQSKNRPPIIDNVEKLLLVWRNEKQMQGDTINEPIICEKMPKRTYITTEEKALPGYKPMKDRITLLFCAKASGDFKIKPLFVYHSENPLAFKKCNIQKSQLTVMWRFNSKAWITRNLFIDWVANEFGPSVRRYLQDNNLLLRALWITPQLIIQASKMTCFLTTSSSSSSFCHHSSSWICRSSKTLRSCIRRACSNVVSR